MKKSIFSFVVLFLSFQAIGAESLKCYAFMGVNYKTRNFDGQIIEIDDTTKVIFDETVSIANHRARIVNGNAQFQYDADYNGKYFRLELTDKTNGQIGTYSGPSASFVEGVDTSLFIDSGKDSTLKVSWDDVERKMGDVISDTLRVKYTTVQCNKIVDKKK